MPIYTYECKECLDRRELNLRIAKMNEPCEAECPACGASESVQRVITGMTISAGVGDFRRKVPDGFKDVLRTMHKNAGSKSTIDV